MRIAPVLAVGATLLLARPAFSARLTLGTGSGVVGGSVTVDVSFAAEGAGVAALQVDVLAGGALSFAGASAGPAAVAAAKSVETAPAPGGARLLVYGLNRGSLPDGIVARLTFAIPPGTAPQTAFILTANAGAADANGGAVSLAANSSTVTVNPSTTLYLSGSRIGVDVKWRSQYSGQTGTATPITKGDQFGFFWFSDAANPELFVKVLDFGSSQPYLLFWAGLTDFEYTVTFSNLSTGATYSVTKPAGSTAGGASTSGLPHVAAVLWGRESGSVEPLPGGWLSARGEARSVARTARPESGSEMLLAGGQVGVTVAWRSQYDGSSGTATPLPQGDQFGFFYFSSAGNPEVFVKVLDWGPSIPYLLFAAGLTDFEYTVTYRNVKTGKAVSWKKGAGAFDGYANQSSLSH